MWRDIELSVHAFLDVEAKSGYNTARSEDVSVWRRPFFAGNRHSAEGDWISVEQDAVLLAQFVGNLLVSSRR